MTNSPSTPSTPTARKPGTIRNVILLTSLAPAAIVSGLWIFNTTTIQRQADEKAAQELVAQSIESLAERLSDISLVTGNDLTDGQMTVSFGQLAREMGQKNLPIHSVAATDSTGKLLGFYRVREDGDVPEQTPAPAEEGADPALSEGEVVEDEEMGEQFITPEMMRQGLSTFVAESGETAEAYQNATRSLVENEKGGLKGTFVTKQGEHLMVAVPATGAGAYLVGEIDSQYIGEKVQDGVNRSLLAIIPAMLVSLALGSWLANSIIGRMRRLSAAVSRAANGDNDVRIPTEGNDEVTLLARDAERLHAGYLTMVAMNEEL